MKIIETPIYGVVVVETSRITDPRGSFARWFCDKELESVIGERRIVQINHSMTAAKGSIRGMHYQKAPCSEMKLIRCVRGRVFDVAVDLRKGSPTFLRWHACELSPDNGLMMVVPEGCAHGFQVMEEDSELLYLHTQSYTPESEGGVLYNDPAIQIGWPLTVNDISERDRNHPVISDSFQGLEI